MRSSLCRVFWDLDLLSQVALRGDPASRADPANVPGPTCAFSPHQEPAGVPSASDSGHSHVRDGPAAAFSRKHKGSRHHSAWRSRKPANLEMLEMGHVYLTSCITHPSAIHSVKPAKGFGRALTGMSPRPRDKRAEEMLLVKGPGMTRS